MCISPRLHTLRYMPTRQGLCRQPKQALTVKVSACRHFLSYSHYRKVVGTKASITPITKEANSAPMIDTCIVGITN